MKYEVVNVMKSNTQRQRIEQFEKIMAGLFCKSTEGQSITYQLRS